MESVGGKQRKAIRWWEPFMALLFVLVWIGGISLGLVVVLDGSALGAQREFVLAAALGGALGGLTGIAGHFISYFRSWQLWSEAVSRTASSETPEQARPPQRWNPTNNLLVKPLLYPVGGIVAGLILALVFLDTGVNCLRILLLGLVGGVLWPTVLKKLPKMFGFEQDDKE